MKIKVSWAGEALFVGESTTGHKVLMDGPTEGGGHDLGPRPMEMLLLGTGACSSYDVISILRKARQDVVSCEVEVSSERAKTEPKVFTDIHIHFKVTGKDLKEKHVERAVSLSAEKYCSASIMLGETAKISHSFEIFDV
ncbi:MAG: peroxiredoxin [Legionellales bacterium]|nr:peroxiredoxin [Legionellales bacterium]HBH10687.1 OsmC family protein [Gammaproteobacteria bacterium]